MAKADSGLSGAQVQGRFSAGTGGTKKSPNAGPISARFFGAAVEQDAENIVKNYSRILV